MKIIKTKDCMEIHTNSLKNLFAGIIFTLFGGQLVYSLLGQENSFYPVLFGSIFAIIGLGILFFSRTTKIILEKEGTTSIISKYTIGMGQTKKETIPTTDISAVILCTTFRQNRTSDGNSTSTTSSMLSLQLKNNDVIKIEESSGGLSISGFNILSSIIKAPLRKEAEHIAEFLNVPIKRTGDSLA